MPYSKEHKQKTRNRILQSAYLLFSAKGYDNVTLDEVMMDCSLTRGGFYAHFKSKSELYSEALRFAASNTALAKNKPKDISPQQWLGQLLDIYLSIEHVKGQKPCPLAFLATDIISRNKTTKDTYTKSYRNMNKLILHYLKEVCECGEEEILSLTSMIIGAVAVSRAVNDEALVEKILSSCRQQVRILIGGI